MSSSTQTTPMIFVIVASRTGTFLFTIFADLSAIRGRMSWTISNFSFVLARWAFFVRCVLRDRKSTRLNSSHLVISYAVFCLKKKKINVCLLVRDVLLIQHYALV